MKKVKIAVTMGDPGGIGPEIIIKYFLYSKKPNIYIVIFGSKAVFDFYMDLFNIVIPINVINNTVHIEKSYSNTALNIIESTKINFNRDDVGKIRKTNGMSAFECVDMAIDETIKGNIDAVVTAPFNKRAVNLAGFDYSGHTEIFSKKTHTRDYVMMLCSPKLRVALVTTHVSLREVANLVTYDRVYKTISIVNESLRNHFGIEKPRIAVASLNPHNSEGGLMGDEEEKFINPAIENARKDGINVYGSFSADTIFTPFNRKRYDCFVSMYHDQGLSALKALYFDSSINVTLGIPIIRTSPDHGTAFDIAGKFQSSYRSLKEAIDQAHKMIRCKQKNR